MVSPAARLLAFLLLLAVMFTGAYAVGAHLGPIAVTHSQQGPGGSQNMQMGHMPMGRGSAR
ncbi:MAG TPA: hypothetical protein VMB74_05240 [Streptosporangiaceae bacterium]|nr:hypothetical protein [Streptosporangiaceae bacterium]